MSYDPDRMIDRRRLKRGVIVWRTLAIIALVVLAIVAVARFGFDGVPGGSHVVRLWLDEVIVDDPAREAALDKIVNDDSAKAVIVRIDSPGGTATGGEALYLALRRIAATKPVVAVMGTTATSGAYMAALAADHIIARESSITGSIGVVLQTVELTGLLGELGVKTEAIKSAPLKAQPSPLEPLTEEARRAAQAIIDDTYALFVDMVAERRKLPRDTVLRLADGRVFTGRQAKTAGLIDALGGELEARAWLESSHAVDVDVPVRDLDRPPDEADWIDLIGEKVRSVIVPTRLRLDGLVSLWQAQPGQ
jgi:protease-4